jgi:hypothetical protein
MAGLTIGKFAVAEGVGVETVRVLPPPGAAGTAGAARLFRGGEVVKQVVGARSRSALMREFADFL